VHGDPKGIRWFGTDLMIDMGEADKFIQVFADWRCSGAGVRWVVERLSNGLLLVCAGSSDEIEIGEAVSRAMS
jgi:ribosomal-protein-alanine N-acetyltransferase